ncbi:MAG: PAS domain S-box protein [Paludibacter sp.]|nr:PAS domain S-box protein [Paludibacter sp.]
MANKIKDIGEKAKLSSTVHNFPIVGIGASAGGLGAFKQLLKAIPADSGMAYVVVQHLNPANESNLTEILARVTKIPIQEITDEVKILPNHIYVMPSGMILTSVDGLLRLTPRDSVKTNLVIDIFFTSIAVFWESMAVGVVLSGTGSDGTIGLKLIKEHGGITIVQDESAEYGDMAQSAVNAGVVDFVLPAEKIPAHLIHIRNTYAVAHALGEEAELPKDDEAVFKQILNLLHQRSGVDFTHYKQSTVRRRIGRRMALHKKGKLDNYLSFLRSDKTEQDALFQDMLIPVTAFFRDPKTFESLTENVFPTLLKNKPEEDAIRIWVAGCSTGEEAYSIAICLYEYLEKKSTPSSGGRGIQIFASDLSELAIKKARTGIFSKVELEGISDLRLDTYFTKDDDRYQISKTIRDLCVFANHNFLKDPPFSKMDLISCRNVLIYMETILQKKALTTFHYALKENGILLLGKSETANAAAELFIPFDKHHKIFSRNPGTGHYMQIATGRREETLTTQKMEAKKEASRPDFRISADAILISKSPASVIVNEQMDIVHLHGDTTPFLTPSTGKPSFNLLKMVTEGLAFELQTALYKAKTSKEPVIREEIPVSSNSKQSLVTIEIIPLIDTLEPHYLILFTKITLPVADKKGNPSSSGQKLKNDKALKRNEQLEKELAFTREDMHSISEYMEIANEELQTANEELHSSNEEMQSLNEELETSKEELQSSNEELTSLNNELIDRGEQLKVSEAKFRNLILQAPVPITTYLGPSFIIDIVNKTALEISQRTYEEALNRPLFEVVPELEESLKSIFSNIYTTGETFIANELPVQFKRPGKPDTAYVNSIYQPLRDLDDKIYGIISIGTDVTESVNARKLIEETTTHLTLATTSANVGIWSLDVHKQKLEWSALHKRMWGYDEHRTDLTYEDWHNLILPEDKQKAFEKIEEAKVHNTMYEAQYYINRANDGALRYMRSLGKYYYNDKGEAETLTGISIDITEQKESELKLIASEEKYRGIFESMDQGFSIIEMIFDSDNKPVDYIFIETNPVFEKQTGLTNAMGKTAKELIPNLEEHWFQAYGKVALTGEPNHFIEASEALGRWFEVYAFRLGDQGSKKVAILFTDITEKKQIEETLRYRQALLEAHNEANRDGLLLVDTKGKIISYNQSFIDVWRMPKEIVDAKDDDLALEFAMTQLVNPQQFVDKVKWLYEHPSLTSIDELEYLDGRIVERHGYSVLGEDGTYYAWSWTFRDITRQRAEQKKSLEQKDEFISIASHEMKTPLTTAKGYIELLLLSLNEENQNALYATKANQAIERLHDLITDLLDASKIQHGQLNYSITTFDLNKMVDETIENIQHNTKNHSIQKAGNCSQPITGDINRLQQVLINLLTNAVKYSPKAEKILVKIEEQESNIQVSVQDFGVGMSSQHLDKVFDRYYRVEEHAIQFQGLGMGLYISNNIVARHDGTMWVESEHGKGSTFYFMLPI